MLFKKRINDYYLYTRPVDNLEPKVTKKFRLFYLPLVKKFRCCKVLKAFIVR